MLSNGFPPLNSSFASPRARCMNPQPQPRIILVLRHVQSLCVSTGPLCPTSLLSSLGQSSQCLRSRAATAAHCRQQQLCTSAAPGGGRFPQLLCCRAPPHRAVLATTGWKDPPKKHNKLFGREITPPPARH